MEKLKLRTAIFQIKPQLLKNLQNLMVMDLEWHQLLQVKVIMNMVFQVFVMIVVFIQLLIISIKRWHNLKNYLKWVSRLSIVVGLQLHLIKLLKMPLMKCLKMAQL